MKQLLLILIIGTTSCCLLAGDPVKGSLLAPNAELKKLQGKD